MPNEDVVSPHANTGSGPGWTAGEPSSHVSSNYASIGTRLQQAMMDGRVVSSNYASGGYTSPPTPERPTVFRYTVLWLETAFESDDDAITPQEWNRDSTSVEVYASSAMEAIVRSRRAVLPPGNGRRLMHKISNYICQVRPFSNEASSHYGGHYGGPVPEVAG